MVTKRLFDTGNEDTLEALNNYEDSVTALRRGNARGQIQPGERLSKHRFTAFHRGSEVYPIAYRCDRDQPRPTTCPLFLRERKISK